MAWSYGQKRGNTINSSRMALKQQTLKEEVAFRGKGLFLGQEAKVHLLPAPAGTGIVFCRSDVPGQPRIAAITENVQEAARCTKIGQNGVTVLTIEHLMAAIAAAGIDNLVVDIAGPEVPIFDGSAFHFLQLIEQAGSLQQEAEKEIYILDRPFAWSQGEMHCAIVPADTFKISYTLHYPQSPYLKSQYYSYTLDLPSFRHEIAPCRTFALYEEIAPLIEKGLLKDAGLESGVVIDGMRVLNPEGLRFPDEMVRHKILDMVGDLALMGCRFQAHLIAIKTGHSANHKIAQELRHFLRKK
jgi:UDP-3-O-[3-hydroxymyristoyl] N-acetylglucosamine deacetylase